MAQLRFFFSPGKGLLKLFPDDVLDVKEGEVEFADFARFSAQN